VAMFLGEFLCFIGYYIWVSIRHISASSQQPPVQLRHCILLLIPAVLDMTATACAYTGLNLTFASSFEMLKGLLFCCFGCLFFVSSTAVTHF
jgi:hypothetical protein